MNKLIDHLNSTPIAIKAGVDIGAMGVAGTAFFTDVMPAVAVTLSVLWLCLQIYTWVINKNWRRK